MTGVKIPERVRCDFCGHLFHPTAFNDRTCIPCEMADAPNQCRDEAHAYDRKANRFHRTRYRVAAREAEKSRRKRAKR